MIPAAQVAGSFTRASRIGRAKKRAGLSRISRWKASPTMNWQRKKSLWTGRKKISAITRVTGPFCVEATIPTPVDWEADGIEGSGISQEAYGSFVERLLETLRKSPILRLEGNKAVNVKNVRAPTKTLSLSAEAIAINGGEKPVAFVFGPENGAVSEKLVYEAAKEANGKNYTHLYVIGFSIQPHARTLIEKCAEAMGVPATYVQATPDLMMGDLLKNMRSSQIFSVCVVCRKLRSAR